MWDLTFETPPSNFTPASTGAHTIKTIIRLQPEDLGPTEMSDHKIDFHFLGLSKVGIKEFQDRGAIFLKCGNINFNGPAWIFHFCGILASCDKGQMKPHPDVATSADSVSAGEVSHQLEFGPLISHTMTTKKGSSGAPIFNEYGEVIAIHLSTNEKGLPAINFAVQISAVCKFLEERVLGAEISFDPNDALSLDNESIQKQQRVENELAGADCFGMYSTFCLNSMSRITIVIL